MTQFRNLEKGMVLGGRFQIEELIGNGKSSAVYRAHDNVTDTFVAVKVLDPFLAQDETSVERFRRETDIIRKLKHPNVIKVFDSDTHGENKYIVMEYFKALNLKESTAFTRSLSLEDFLKFAKTLVSTVRACHTEGIVHRDLKPQNILFSEQQQMKLVDFGISRINSMSDLTKTGTILGTPEYMSPEAFMSSHTDRRRDIYAIGVIFYEWLAGTPPYTGQTLAQIMSLQAKSEFKPLSEVRSDLPEWLCSIVTKCLKRDPIQRYQSCEELMFDLTVGEKSQAGIENLIERASCPNCRSEMLPALVFCHCCGQFSVDSYQAGGSSVVLYKADAIDPVYRYLTKSFPNVSSTVIKSKLHHLPALVMSGVSEETGRAIANEISAYSVATEVVSSLPRQFRLSIKYYSLAAFALAPLFFLYNENFVIQAGGVLAAELSIYLYFRFKTIPIIRLQKLSSRAERTANVFLKKIAPMIRDTSDQRLQAVLGKIAAQYQLLRNSHQDSISKNAWLRLESSITACCLQGSQTALLISYLSERSPNDLRRKISGCEAKLKLSNSTLESERIIQEKANLLAEYNELRLNQERYDEMVNLFLSFIECMRTFKLAIEQGVATSTDLDGVCDFNWSAEVSTPVIESTLIAGTQEAAA